MAAQSTIAARGRPTLGRHPSEGAWRPRTRAAMLLRSRPKLPSSGDLMDQALAVHRLHFAFTVTFHYLFPQLTMGLALLLVVLKTIGEWRHDDGYLRAARFWGQVFAINFVLGVVTGIPMEFQFGTDWAEFSRLTGGVIGQPL